MKEQYFIYDDKIGCVEYIQHMGKDITVVNAARVSFGKEKDEMEEADEKLVGYLIKNQHTSTLEHNCVTFRFTVPLFIRSQHHRHRTWAFNEISRRYTQENLQFYEPKTFRTQHESNRQASNEDKIDPSFHFFIEQTASNHIINWHKESVNLYNALLENGVCREQARGVLPQNMYTQYYGTVNLNNLFKFINLRMDSHAQWEIQKVAEACLEIAKEIWPITVKQYMKQKGK